MRDRKKSFILEKVEIIDAGSEGKGVGKQDGMVVFVPFTAPGDVVDVNVFSKKKSYAEGRVIHFHKRSERRVDPVCEHFGLCGGCKWQHLNYQDQLFFKQKIVKDNFERIGWLDIGEFRSIIGSESQEHYRNKLEFTFSNRRWFDIAPPSSPDSRHDSRALGFHLPGMYDRVIDIHKCHLQADPSDEIRQAAADIGREMELDFYDTREHKGYLRTIIIRTVGDGQVMVILMVAEDKPEQLASYIEALLKRVPAITSMYYAINPKHNDALYDLTMVLHSGSEYLEERMDDLKFRIGPKSFFQTNSNQAIQIYRTVKEFAGLDGSQVVYDLYCGTGTIACFIARDAQKVIGVETIEDAVLDAKENARLNGLENIDFVAGDLGRMFNADFIDEHGRPDVIITDPPRAGMQPKVLNMLMELAAPCIVYVSCNPATQARDCSILAHKYDISIVQPIDMFPHTQHVENVALLTLRQDNS